MEPTKSHNRQKFANCNFFLKNPSQCSHFKGVHEGAEKILPITKLINVNFLLPTMIIIIIAFILLLKLK